MIQFLCASVLAAQIVDATTFAAFFMLPVETTAAEQNPVVRLLMAVGGVTLVVAVKLGWGYFIWHRAPRYAAIPPGRARSIVLVVLPLVVAGTLVGAAFNTHSFVTVLEALR